MNMVGGSPASGSWSNRLKKLVEKLREKFRRSQGTLRPLTASLFLLLTASLLSGCVTTGRSTGSTAQAGNKCGPFKAISYDSRRDTPRTVQGVRVHNKAGANYGCWRKP